MPVLFLNQMEADDIPTLAIGIDLGTTYFCVVVYRGQYC